MSLHLLLLQLHFASFSFSIGLSLMKMKKIFDMKWMSVHHHISIEIIKTNERISNKRKCWSMSKTREREGESAECRKNPQRWNQECIQFNECNFTISTNNHNILGSLFVDCVSFVISLPFYARFSPFFIHSTAQTRQVREMKRENVKKTRTRTRRHIVSVIGWMVVTHFVDNATKTIEIEIRLYYTGCHFNASNRSKMSVQNIRYYVHYCGVNGNNGAKWKENSTRTHTHTHTRPNMQLGKSVKRKKCEYSNL